MKSFARKSLCWVEIAGRATSWTIAALLVAIVLQVILRYVFKESFIALQDAQWYLYAVAFMVSISYTTSQDGQVKVDILYNRFSAKARSWIDIAGHLIFALPLYSFLMWEGWRLTANSFRLSENSGNVDGLHWLWAVKAFIPIGCGLLVIASLARSVLIFTSSDSSTPEDTSDVS